MRRGEYEIVVARVLRKSGHSVILESELSSGQKKCDGLLDDTSMEIKAVEGARYTVPSTVNTERMGDLLTVRFRVGAVFQDSYVSVYFDDERVMHIKKKIMAPGEMEQVILKKSALEEHAGLKTITVKIEKE